MERLQNGLEAGQAAGRCAGTISSLSLGLGAGGTLPLNGDFSVGGSSRKFATQRNITALERMSRGIDRFSRRTVHGRSSARLGSGHQVEP